MNLFPIVFLLLLALANPATASETRFTDWMPPGELESYLASQPNNQYPIIVEARPLLGDGVAFRVLFADKPSENFDYMVRYGLSGNDFRQSQKELKEKGYMLVFHQSVVLMAGESHQAVWIRN